MGVGREIRPSHGRPTTFSLSVLLATGLFFAGFQEQFSRCGQTFRYRKLLFSLAWFHAILLERRKFKSLGFNVPYEFNESDFSICHDLVIVFLDEVSKERN